MDEELEVVGEAADGVEAVALAGELQPDVVLMDLLMPRMDGIAATESIRRSMPEVEVIALTSVLENQKVFDAMQVGAMGYLLKDTRADQLCQSIRAAAAGQVQLSPEAMHRLMDHLTLTEATEPLTPRETQVLRLIATGVSNREIGVALDISLKTVKTHVSNIFSKLDVLSRTEAALYAVRTGLVDLGGTEP
jgi:DNA-binding NarL/FixJ family response regulator